MRPRFDSFREFYPYYLSQHRNRYCRRLHVLGTLTALALIVVGLLTPYTWLALPLAPVVGYGASWSGHFFFERNPPAAFRHPGYSLLGDLAMLRDVLRGRLSA
jgi:hypothetical protein